MVNLALSRRTFLFGTASSLLGGAASAVPDCPSASRFTDSVGVNIHLSSEPYASNFQLVRSLLGESGIRHVRDELRSSNDLGRWRALFFQEKVRSHLLVSPVTNSTTEMLKYLEALGVDKVSAIEGQNEGDSDWFKSQPAARNDWSLTVNTHQREVFLALRSRYPAHILPILSPTVLDYKPEDMLLIRPSADFCDIVALHAYAQHGDEPETDAPYSSLSWYKENMSDRFKPGAPIMVTETGYNNMIVPGGAGVSEAAAAIYLPRLLLHNFSAGVERTFLYEFLDEGTDPNEWEQHWGLVGADGRRKPAFDAIAAMLQAFGEEGQDLEKAGSLPIQATLRAAPPRSRMLQFRKADGSVLLALWRAVPCWDVASAKDVVVAPEPVTVTLNRPVGRAAFMVPNDAPSWKEIPASGNEIHTPVSAKLVLVRLAGQD
jgi:hypothetical protein